MAESRMGKSKARQHPLVAQVEFLSLRNLIPRKRLDPLIREVLQRAKLSGIVNEQITFDRALDRMDGDFISQFFQQKFGEHTTAEKAAETYVRILENRFASR